MKKILILVSLLALLTNCSTSSPKKSAAENLKIINLKNEFVEFWAKAKGQPFDVQIKFWDNIIEKPHQDFYDQFVWSKKYNKKWKQYKKSALKKSFTIYEKEYDKILNNFVHFDSTLKKQIKFYRSQFRNAQFDLPIYAVVAPTFNGRVADLCNLITFGTPWVSKIG